MFSLAEYSKETKALLPLLFLITLLTFFEPPSFSFSILLLSLSFIYVKYYEGLKFETIGVVFEHFIFRASFIGIIIYYIMTYFGAFWQYNFEMVTLINILLLTVSETFFWIGVVQRKLQEKHFAIGLIITAFLFSISHMNSWYFSTQYYNIVFSFLTMLALGYLYNITSRIYTGNIFPPMVARLIFTILLFFIR